MSNRVGLRTKKQHKRERELLLGNSLVKKWKALDQGKRNEELVGSGGMIELARCLFLAYVVGGDIVAAIDDAAAAAECVGHGRLGPG